MTPTPDNTPPLEITSLQNARVKAIRALDMRKERKQTGLFVAEGASVLITAADNNVWPETLITLARSANPAPVFDYIREARSHGAELLEVSTAVLEKLSHKDNPQTLLGVFKQHLINPPQKPAATETWLALEDIRDPGNLGTIIRTSDATGIAGILLAGQTCDPFSRECVRATMGSLFSVPLARIDRDAFATLLASWPGDTVGTHLDGTADFRTHTYRAPTLIVMGAEGPGLSDSTARACKSLVRIPMAGKLDSLNLAVATGLMLYEVQRKKLTLR